MNSNSSDNLSRALTLLQQTALSEQPASRSRRKGQPDLEELFLAELRMRRARLQEWMAMLNQEMDGEAERVRHRSAARMSPQSCRRRVRQAAAAK